MNREEFQNIDWSKPRFFRITYTSEFKDSNKRFESFGPAKNHTRFGATITYKYTYKEGEEGIRDSYFPCEMLWECNEKGKPILPYVKEINPDDMWKCPVCSKLFSHKERNSIFCSDRCQEIYKANKAEEDKKNGKGPVKKKCEFCGKEFETTYSNKKFCSSKCRKKAYAKKESDLKRKFKPEKNPEKEADKDIDLNKDPGSNKITESSKNEEVLKSPKEIKKSENPKDIKVKKVKICALCGKEFETLDSRKKYCCYECRVKASNKKKSERRKRNRRPKVKHCKFCGKEFETNLNYKTYCCRNCARAAGRERIRKMKTLMKLWGIDLRE